MVFDSYIGFIDIQSLSLKGNLSSEKRHSVINYLKLSMNVPTDRATINETIYIFYFNKYLKHKRFEFQNVVLIKEQIISKWLKWISAGFSILGSLIKLYNNISPSTGIRVADLVATTSHGIN